MSTIRLALTAATTGTLGTITETMNVVSTIAASASRVSEVGLINATGWRDAALADQHKVQEERLAARHDARAVASLARAESLLKMQEKLEANPKLAAIYYDLVGKPKLSVAAE
jgi:hypothetical protein